MDRAPRFERGRREFDSLRGYHLKPTETKVSCKVSGSLAVGGVMNKIMKKKLESIDPADDLKKTKFLCNRDLKYLAKISNNNGEPMRLIPRTILDKLMTLGVIEGENISLNEEGRDAFATGNLSPKLIKILDSLGYLESRDVKITEKGKNAFLIGKIGKIQF